MVTGFHIDIVKGYASYAEADIGIEKLIEIAKLITYGKFYDKCKEYGVPDVFDCGKGCTLDKFIRAYEVLPTQDSTCTFTDTGIMQMACGGNAHRQEREQIRKAFAILVVNECFKQGYCVSLIIA